MLRIHFIGQNYHDQSPEPFHGKFLFDHIWSVVDHDENPKFRSVLFNDRQFLSDELTFEKKLEGSALDEIYT